MAPSSIESEADKLGRTVLRKRLGLKPKERVTIEAYPSSLNWAAGFVREARRIGAYPIVHYEDEAAYWDAAEHGKSKLVGSLSDQEKATLEETDVYVYFWGPEDLDRRERLADKTQESLVSFNPDWYKRAQKAGLRGARMAIARATEPNAKRYGVSLDDWRGQLLAASVRDPSAFQPTVRKLERHLGGKGEVRLTHSNGTDLTLALAERPVQKDIGVLAPRREWGRFRMMVNVPPGSVYVSVDESSADGTLVANRSTTAPGPILDGGRWTFKDGKLTDYHYDKGNAEFDRIYRAATGAKDRPGFLEVGINPDIHGAPLQEENEFGSVTVGIGNNNGFGGKNKSSIFQFLTLAGASLTIGGRSVVEGGRVA
jgi:leucyl aminopeptidase (aminopeptidase T)